ncbi:hypothetical protein Tco_1240584 [Tanacetum coccineum]
MPRRFFLRLNLPDHRSVLTDSKVHIKIEVVSTCSSKVKFIATCSYSRFNDFTTSRENNLSNTISEVACFEVSGLHKDGDADTSFQQSQVHSHMLILKAQ